MRLTKRFVENATVTGKGRESWYMDDEVRGLGLRVWKTGDKLVRSYALRYRKNGPPRKLKIGDASRMSLDQARKEARRLLAMVDRGEDPIAQREDDRQAPTVADLVERYLKYHTSRNKSRDQTARIIKRYVLPALGKKKVADVTRPDVESLKHSITSAGKPIAANRVLAILSSMMTYAEEVGWRLERSNPCRRVRRNPENKRERYLTTAELERLGAALNAAEGKEHPSALAAIRLLLLTGCRKGEILTLRWEHVDLQRGLLLLPDSKTGAKTVPLGAPAVALLNGLTRVEGNPYVCWGERPGGHLIGLYRAWNRLREAAGLADLRIHDLRHSFASVGAGSGLGLPIIGRLLGHATPITTARYAHLADHPVQRAADAIAGEIAAALDRRPSSVVPFARAAR